MKVLRTIAALAVICACAGVSMGQEPPFDPSSCRCGGAPYGGGSSNEETVVAIQEDSPMGMNAFGDSQMPNASQKHAKAQKKDAAAPVRASFAWGADIGASIDLTGNDMSAFEFNVLLGVKRGWLNFLGAGVGADISITNSSRAYPVFLAFRTNFRDRPSVLFWDLRGGMAYNQLEHNHEQWGVYGSTGVGVNLARSSKFNSSLSLNYVFRQRKKVVGTEMTHDFTDLHMISVRLGVIF